MAHMLVQAGSTLYRVDLTTGTATSLSLPTDVTLSTTRKPRFATLNQWIVMVNSPTRNLSIDPEGIVRPLVPMPPTHGPTMVAGSGTGLTGAYLYAMNFRIMNAEGELLTESPLSPLSASVTLANNDASLSQIQISPDTISLRAIYRTLSGGDGTELFHINDVDGNIATTLLENTADAIATLIPVDVDSLVAPPGTLPGLRMKNIVSWKSRLWGVADDPQLVDTVFISETNKVYAWPDSVVAYPTGQDSLGVVAFAPRRNQLGFLKRNGVWMVGASSGSTGIAVANLSVSQIAYDKGGTGSPDTVIVINDKAYWLGKDGVYEWDDAGVKSVTDETVAPWFQTDTYFNRARFPLAFARYNELRSSYELHLAAAGSTSEDRWISYNVITKKWYGPHKSGLVTPTHAAGGVDADGLPTSWVGGSDGIIYTANSSLARDGASTAIDFDCMGPFHNADAPDVEHFWGQLSMLTKVENAGTLTITPYIGRLSASAGSTISHDLTKGRERLRRLGDGAMARLRLQQATVNQKITVYGYEIEPIFENGKR